MKKIMSYLSVAFGVALVSGLVYGVIEMFYLTGQPGAMFLQPATWFDPTYFQYNLLLALFAILIVPVITIFYVVRMKEEKIRSVKTELTEDEYSKNRDYIHKTIDKSFRIRNYIGSIITLTSVVIFGVSIFLLFKPVPLVAPEAGVVLSGVDFNKGANFLMLGPYMYQYITGDTAYVTRLMISLTAFMYGFAGAYTYLIGHMVRSYYTLDLVPNIFVSSAIRMMTGSILALVLSFAFADTSSYMLDLSGKAEETGTSLIPIFSFFIGFFPGRGLMLLTKIANKGLGLGMKSEEYKSIPLNNLSGMSQSHEMRLNREGFDNLDNMANACWLDLALRTGFSYSQLRSWAGQAWLYNHFGIEDYEKFKSLSGISDAHDLEQYLAAVADSKAPDWQTIFNKPATAHLVNKAEVVSQLLPGWLNSRTPQI